MQAAWPPGAMERRKTTLVDKLLTTCEAQVLANERLLDSNALEKERGITIMSKATRLNWGDKVLNVVDTPGHADFGGEVERVLSMVDGVLLVVDATEGPMSQTKFVLGKALECGISDIVCVINKADRDTARLDGEVESEIFDLFDLLGATEEQLEYPTFFASAKEGWATEDVDLAMEWSKMKREDRPKEGHGAANMVALLDCIVSTVPPPSSAALEQPLAFAVNSIGTDSYVGRLATGKIEAGVMSIGTDIRVLQQDGTPGASGRVTAVYGTRGVERVALEGPAGAGDIVTVAGVDCGVGDTITTVKDGVAEPLATPPIAPSTLSMVFGTNDSPLGGREGTHVTSTKIKDRLIRETENNVTISVAPVPGESEKMEVRGRGELQLGILIENMRREGYELCVSPPQVILTRDEETGQVLEPFEEVTVDVDTDYSGQVIEGLTGDRRGNLVEMKDSGSGKSRLVFHVPSRGLLGFGPEIKSETHGSAIVNSIFLEMQPHIGTLGSGLKKGKLISMATGTTTGYALMPLEARGTMFVGSGVDVYEGMIVGESAKAGDVEVNPCKAKQTTNMRASKADEKIVTQPPRIMSLEDYIVYMDEDEMLEVTPSKIRLRKKFLDSNERKRMEKKGKNKSL
eukprot:scaffold1014_cov260-Pinguiococcus_pyrenoidosus.AAC.11